MLINLQQFAGLVPKVSDRQLPANYAAQADNTQLYSGEVRGLREPETVADLSAEIFTVRRAYRLEDGATSIADTLGDWVPFDEAEVNFIRGALVNDQFDRYYAAGGTLDPVVDTAVNWAAGGGGIDLGVPAPTTPPTVVPPASGTVDETRAYVYTFVNEWGEESAPSPASDPATGDVTLTWVLSAMQIAYPVAGNHNAIDKTRIYRTVTGTSSVNYRFVAEVDPPNAGYNDDQSNDTVSLNESLSSLGWDLPPAGLQGIVNMANGIMAGFVGRDLYFCEPYRPHAWPANYIISTENNVVGIGVYQSGIVVCTTSNPYVATGSHPSSITLTKLDDVEPCQSFRSIVNGLNGVVYASQNGLVLVNQTGAQNITSPLMTRNEWRDGYSPETTVAAADGSRTLAFTSLSSGYLFNPVEQLGYLVNLTGFADITAVQTDQFTGEAYIIARDVVFLWNPTTTVPLSYVWKSKVFELPFPVNMGAYRLQYEDVVSDPDLVPGFDYTNYNASRITLPLDTLNLQPLNGVRTETGMTDSPPVVQNRNPIGGSPLQPLEPLTVRDNIRIRIWGDGVLRYDEQIMSQQMQRLPSGYKADKWQIEFTSAQNIYSFKMAGTGKELAKA
jgi:hypothetical protein